MRLARIWWVSPKSHMVRLFGTGCGRTGFAGGLVVIQARDARPRSASVWLEGCLRGVSGQTQERGRLFDGGHRAFGVFAVLHAVGVVPVVPALARGRAQDV